MSVADSGGDAGEGGADLGDGGGTYPLDGEVSEHGDSAAERSAELTVAADDPGLVYTGRFDRSDPAIARCGWSGCAVTAWVDARSVRLRISDGRGANLVNVIVDNGEPRVLELESGEAEYELARDLGPGTHSIQVFRRTEALFGEMGMMDWILEDALPLRAPQPPQRSMIFVGDSITCGFGNEGLGPDCEFSAETENGYLAFGAILARRLGAAYTAIAWSGKGIYRNGDGSHERLMPILFERTLPLDQRSRWTSQDSPQAVVINLGTNDFANGIPPRDEFVSAYLALVKSIRDDSPQAAIFCTIGSMMGGLNLTTIRSYLQEVVDTRSDSGDQAVHLLDLEPQSSVDGLGCSWHPSVATHEIMANTLEGPIREILSW